MANMLYNPSDIHQVPTRKFGKEELLHFCFCAVFEVTNRDAEALKKALQTPAEDGVVRLRGLPFSSTEADIIEFFSGKNCI